jgi:hypothetical protein
MSYCSHIHPEDERRMFFQIQYTFKQKTTEHINPEGHSMSLEPDVMKGGTEEER